MNKKHYIKNLWLWKCNKQEIPDHKEKLSYDELRKTEWSEEFEKLMRNRLLMGFFRYGRMGDKNKPVYDRKESILSRIFKYEETGNTEYLVDIANLCMLEFVEGRHKNKHFKSIDDGEHVKIK
jgi:hypothetical protein